MLFENDQQVDFENIDEVKYCDLNYSTDKKIINRDNFMEVNVTSNESEIIFQTLLYSRSNDVQMKEFLNENTIPVIKHNNDEHEKSYNYKMTYSVVTPSQGETDVDFDISWDEDFELKLSEESEHELTCNQSKSNIDFTNNKNENENMKSTSINDEGKSERDNILQIPKSVEPKVGKYANTETKNNVNKTEKSQSTLLDYSYANEKKDTLDVMVNVKKLLLQLKSSKVVLERLPESLVTKYLDKIIYYTYCCERCQKVKEISSVIRAKNKCETCGDCLKLKCNKCKILFASLRYTVWHAENCYNITGLTFCPVCNYKYSSRSKLFRHVSKYHRELLLHEKYACEKCQREFHHIIGCIIHRKNCKA